MLPCNVVVLQLDDGHVEATPMAFEAAAIARNLVAEWLEADAGSMSVADTVLQHARTADLVVAAQTDAKWPGSMQLDIADRLVMGSGRPVLIIPNVVGAQQRLGKKVVVAWNGRREAARGIRCAAAAAAGG
jgi:hypothetical protein